MAYRVLPRPSPAWKRWPHTRRAATAKGNSFGLGEAASFGGGGGGGSGVSAPPLPMQQDPAFWSALDTELEGLALPPRWAEFTASVRASEDLHAIYDTDPRREPGLQQRVKAFGHYPGLGVHRPFWHTGRGGAAEAAAAALPFVEGLQAEADAVRSELDAWVAAKDSQGSGEDEGRGGEGGGLGGGEAAGGGDREGAQEDEDAWTTRFFNGSYGESFHGIALVRDGREVAATRGAFPRTLGLLRRYGVCGANRLVFFARQRAGSGITPHSDCVNYLLTGHLGVVVPPAAAAASRGDPPPGGGGKGAGSRAAASTMPEPLPCGMAVLGQTHAWRQDEVVVFQNCFPHHTWNEAAEDRILLYFDLWHPALTPDECTALTVFDALRKQHEAAAAAAAAASGPDMNPQLEHLLRLGRVK